MNASRLAIVWQAKWTVQKNTYFGAKYLRTKKRYFLPGAIYRHPVTPCRWLAPNRT